MAIPKSVHSCWTPLHEVCGSRKFYVRHTCHIPKRIPRYVTQVDTLPGHASEERANRLLSTPKGQKRLSGPPSLLSDGHYGPLQGVKRVGRDADSSSSSRTEIRKEWSYKSTLPILHDVNKDKLLLSKKRF